MTEQGVDPKVISGVNQALSEEKALNVNAKRFYCMPFSFSQPNSPSLLLALVVPLVLSLVYSLVSLPSLNTCFFVCAI